MSKYNSDSSCGFDSKLEAAVHQILQFKEKAGLICDIRCQQTVELTEAKIRCKIDFSYEDSATKERIYVEAKGMETDRWKIIQKLWVYYGPGHLMIYRGRYEDPKLATIIYIN